MRRPSERPPVSAGGHGLRVPPAGSVGRAGSCRKAGSVGRAGSCRERSLSTGWTAGRSQDGTRLGVRVSTGTYRRARS